MQIVRFGILTRLFPPIDMVQPHMVATGWGSSGSSLGCVLDTQLGIAHCIPGGLQGALLDVPSHILDG